MSAKIVHLASSVPLYIQIAENLISKIESGDLKPGDKLPSERSLGEQYSVQRATVRQALDVLEHHGLIIRKRGSGTFIAKAKIEREATRLFAFTKIMSSRGFLTGAKILSFSEQKADARASRKLSIDIGQPIYYIHRLRLLDNEPMMLEKIQLPKHIFPKIDQYDFEKRSLFEIMENEYSRVVTSAEQVLEAVPASEYEINVLGMPPGSSIMMEERVSRDQFGMTVEFSRDLYRGDRFRFIVENARFDIEIKQS